MYVCVCEFTYSHGLHLIQGVQSLRSDRSSAAFQGLEDAVEGEEVWLHFLLLHLGEQFLQTDRRMLEHDRVCDKINRRV